MLRAWLSRARDGRYMLTQLQPISAIVGDTGKFDLYVAPGDVIGYRGMCPAITEAIWSIHLDRLESVEVWLEGGTLKRD